MLSIVVGLLMTWIAFSIFWKSIRHDFHKWSHKPDPKELSTFGKVFLLPAEIAFRLLKLTVYVAVGTWNGLMYAEDSTESSRTRGDSQ